MNMIPSTRLLRTPATTLALANIALLTLASVVSGQTTTEDGTPLPVPPASVSIAAVSPTDQAASAESVVVSAEAAPTPHDDYKAKLNHIMSEVSGTQVTVTKKATVIKLDQQPPIEKNDLQT